MSDSNALEEAASRLIRALETIEKTVAERRHATLRAEALEEQVQTLTASLGTERQRCERLEAASDEVSERLDSMIDSVRTMLGAR